MSTENTQTKVPETDVNGVERTRTGRAYRPRVDILDRADDLLLLADLPGLKIDDIEVRFEDGELTIHGRTPPRQSENTVYVAQEYGVGDFHRSFRMNEEVYASEITAQYENGVLQLRLPKATTAAPRRIKVHSA